MEQQLIEWLAATFPDSPQTHLGIGDDCAIIEPTQTNIIFTSDSVCDGVHFESEIHAPERIGHKALAVNLSDLSAMGALPTAAVVSLVIPQTSSLEYVQRIYLGMQPTASKFNVSICGGDTATWDGKLMISIAAIGAAPESGAWRLDAAKAQQQILVTGSLGGSILGKHLDFQPRCQFANQWRNRHKIRAATDVSDSLTLDLNKMALASGLGFRLFAEQIPVSKDAIKLSQRGSERSPLEHALTDGEDFELILAVDPGDVDQLLAESKIPLQRIGEFTESKQQLIVINGNWQTVTPIGYRHSFKCESD